MHHVILGAGPAGVIAAETLRKAATDTINSVGEAECLLRMAIPYLTRQRAESARTCAMQRPFQAVAHTRSRPRPA